MGKPFVDHIKGDIWEIRCSLNNRIARVLFAIIGQEMILLHGFIKKTQKTPIDEIQLAESRFKEYEKHT